MPRLWISLRLVLPAVWIGLGGWLLIAAMWIIMAVESFGIRPALAARSDVIIAGGDPGESWLHYGYIAAELLLLAVLVCYVVLAARRIRVD